MRKWTLILVVFLSLITAFTFWIRSTDSADRAMWAQPAGAILLSQAGKLDNRTIYITCGLILGLTAAAAGLFGTERGIRAVERLLGRLAPVGSGSQAISLMEAERLEWRCRGCQHLRSVTRMRRNGNLLLTPHCEGQCGTKEALIDL